MCWFNPFLKGEERKRVLTIITISLIVAAVPLIAFAQYEEPPTLSASEILPPELLKGPNHSVADNVQNDGLFNHYEVSSPFGTVIAHSTSALRFLVNELNAIAEMKKVETDDTAIASLKQSGANTVTGIKNLFTEPEDTIKGAASGVKSLFNRASETIGSREVTGAEDSKVQQIIGYSNSKGQIANTYGVNVYSRNQLLQEELDRLAWADYLGGLGVGMATSVVPGVGGVVLTTSGTARLLNEAINTTPASELWIQNRDKLLALGMNEDTVQLFLNNQVFSPALLTVITSALETMKGVENLELFLKVALQASTPEMARVITELAVLTAGYHKHIAPLAKMVPMARITRAVKKDGSVVVVLPTDHLIWSEKVSGVLAEINKELDAGADVNKAIWLLGDLSAMALQEYEKAGWKIHTSVRSQLIPKKE